MGVVYLREPMTRRSRGTVALKVLAAGAGTVTPPSASDFSASRRLAASLDHPHIVPDLPRRARQTACCYLAMRYVEGTDLRGAASSARGGSTPERAARARRRRWRTPSTPLTPSGLVHRDVKPGNVLIATHAGKEHCYLADFGLTKRTGSMSGADGARRRRGHAGIHRARADHGWRAG